MELGEGRFELIERVGEGANATVWRAVEVASQRQVAVKLLRPDTMTPEDVRRLMQEAEILSKLRHPCIIRIFGTGVTSEGNPYVVMEWIDGVSLREELMQRRMLPLADVVVIVEQVCGALVEAHVAGVVHRDVKPENVLLGAGAGRLVKLADFGTAKQLDPSAPVLTFDDKILGTPHYMAPERASGRPVGGAADVYAVAVMTYEMLEGRLPFDAKNPIVIVTQHIKDPPPPMRAVTPDVEQTVIWGLAKDPVARPSAEQFAEQLGRAAGRSSNHVRRG